MDAAGDPDRDQAEARRPRRTRQGQHAAQEPQQPDDHPDEREGAHRIPHVLFGPVELRHRHSRKHGERHGNGLQNDHFSTPL
jgi:hypothetical protein